MQLKSLLVSLSLLCISTSSYTQHYCGQDDVQQKLLLQDPAYAARFNAHQNQWSQYAQLLNSALVIQTANGPIYEIPCVIHVMHTGGAVGTQYNPADTTLQHMIDYLNYAYAAQWSGYPDSNSGGTYLPIRFVLAKRSSNCATSTGIVRYNAGSFSNYSTYGIKLSGSNGVTDSAIKSLSIWPTTDYYNIWVVNKIDGADGTGTGSYTAGFAYIPPAYQDRDGTVILAHNAVQGDITIPHETAHYLGIYHTFQGGSTSSCPSNTNCNTDGDKICDTDPEMQSNFNCPSGTNPCTGTGYNFIQHNFMDYSSCQDRFTHGQRTKILYTLLNMRSGLLSSVGGVAPLGSSPATACSVTIGATHAGNNNDMGVTKVVLNDLQANSGGYSFDNYTSYIDKTCTQQANLISGSSYTLSVTSGQYNNENAKAWIDFNNDGTFQSTEMVLNSAGTSNNQTHTATVAVPTTGVSTCVPLRMRVMADFVGSAAIQACNNLDYGQAEDYTVVVYNPSSASLSITAGSNPGCLGVSVTFTAASVNMGTSPTYTWYVNNVSAGTGLTFSTTTLANGDSVRVKATATTSGCRLSDSVFSSYIHMTLGTLSSSPTGSSNSPICSGSTLNLYSTTVVGATYSWIGPGSYTSTQQNPVITNAQTSNSGTYYVTASIGGCASSPSPVVAVVNATPVITAGSNTPVCSGNTLSFTATGIIGASYTWTGPNSFSSPSQNPSITNVQLSDSGLYICYATLSGCNSLPDTEHVVVKLTPLSPTASSNSPVCAGAALNLSASAVSGATYSWTGPGSYSSSTQNPTITNIQSSGGGTYSVTATVNGCTSSAGTVTVTVKPTPAQPTAAGNSPICIGDTLKLNVSSSTLGVTYSWMGPVSFTSISQYPMLYNAQSSNTGLYIVTCTLNGCTSIPDTVTVSVNPMVVPKVAITSNPSVVVPGSPVTFTANPSNGGATPAYQWSKNGNNITGATNPTYLVTPAVHDTFCVHMTSNAPCVNPTSADTCFIVVPVGVNTITSASSLELYPNPNEGVFTLQLSNAEKNALMQVYDMTGKKVAQQILTFEQEKTNIQLNLSTGVYMLRLLTANESNTVKLVIEK